MKKLHLLQSEYPHQLKPSNRQTHILPGLESRGAGRQRANPAVAVICYSWCRAVGFIRAAVGCVCAVGLPCAVCVLAMWLKMWLQDDTYMIRPEERVLILPVVVDRSNNSPFYIIAFGAVGVFIILSVLGLQYAQT